MNVTAALLCLALNVYHEARGEPFEGQLAVAQVTMNRAGQDSQRVCPTVTKPKQFSWTNDLLVRHHKGWKLKPEGVPKETKAWQNAVFVAQLVLNQKINDDVTKGSDHYHEKSIRPKSRWDLRLEKTVVIGQHVFYKPQGKK